MNPNQPINFISGSFVYPKDRKVYARGQKEYISLPSREKIIVNGTNLWNSIKQIFIPVSQMWANVTSQEFVNSIDGNENIAFYDIETNDKEEFVLGYVNEIKFIDPLEMCKELVKYDIVVGFNNFNFDNQILLKYGRNYFNEISNANFIAYSFKNALNIDILSIIRTIVGKEAYSQESLAKESLFPEEILNHDAPKDDKCKQDIRILKFLWDKYNIPLAFNTISKLINVDATLWQIIKKERVRKWILVNTYLRRGFLPLKPNNSNTKMTSEPVKFCKKGFYENYVYQDIKSAYPQTAVNLGNLGIYPNDNTFSELQKELMELANETKLKPYMKSISNPLIGSQYSQNEYFRDDEIFSTIVKTVSDKVNDILKNRKDIVLINTDCFVVPDDSKKPEIDGYEIREQYRFSELYVYNVNRWIGKTKERIEFRGFKSLNSKTPKILKVAMEEILNKLMKKKGTDFKDALDDYENLVSKILKNVKKFDNDYFNITIRKKNEYCTNLEFMDIWKSLPSGFSNIYYGKDGILTADSKKIDYKYYCFLIKSLAREFSTDKDL